MTAIVGLQAAAQAGRSYRKRQHRRRLVGDSWDKSLVFVFKAWTYLSIFTAVCAIEVVLRIRIAAGAAKVVVADRTESQVLITFLGM